MAFDPRPDDGWRLMDVVATLSFIDRWFADQQTTCGVTRVVVTFEERHVREARVVRIKLTCPRCDNSISGCVLESDMPQVVALLADKGGA